MRSTFGLALLVVLAAPARAQDRPPAVKELLARAAAYVETFQHDFSSIISLEQYQQHAEQLREAPPRAWLTVSSEKRTLNSEMLFTRLPQRAAWLTARNVLSVDGKAVPDSADRLDRALSESGSGVLRLLLEEGARFNLGRIRRNVNDPTFALRFLDSASQSGFAFGFAGREHVGGVDAWRLTYVERTPSLVRNERNESLPATGAIWLAVSDGTVVRTSFTITDKRAHLQATSVVDYRSEPKLAMWVPVFMTESYVQKVDNVEERILCTATYSDFRRFETSGRLLVPR